MIANLTNYKGQIIWEHSKPDGTLRKRLNIKKIKNVGWESKIKLKEGLIQTIKDYKSTTFLSNKII